MSKHDFTDAEFADRLARARQAVAGAGLDWMVLFHPVSILWLTGGEVKSYRAFQCLLLAARRPPADHADQRHRCRRMAGRQPR